MNKESQETTGKEAYELRKQQRQHARTTKHMHTQPGKIKKILSRLLLWGVIIGLLIYGGIALVRSTTPQGEDRSVSYEIQGAAHILDGSSHPPYNSNPPSSGWHYGQPARGGFYDEAIPDERVIHNLEHGDIWIAYHPRVSDDIKSQLEKFAGRYTVVSPREENEGDISLVAWGRVDTFNIENGVFDEGRVKDFILRYDNRGPERVRTAQTPRPQTGHRRP